MTTAWRLGLRRELCPLRLREHAHGFGYRGVCLTHSRRYSTSLTALRRARYEHRKEKDGAREDALQFGSRRYAGRGYVRSGDHLLAAMWHASAELNRWAYWLCRGDDYLQRHEANPRRSRGAAANNPRTTEPFRRLPVLGAGGDGETPSHPPAAGGPSGSPAAW